MEKTAYEIGFYWALRQAGFNKFAERLNAVGIEKFAEELKEAGLMDVLQRAGAAANQWTKRNTPTFRRWLGVGDEMGHNVMRSTARRTGAAVPRPKPTPAPRPAPVAMTPEQLASKARREAVIARAKALNEQQKLLQRATGGIA